MRTKKHRSFPRVQVRLPVNVFSPLAEVKGEIKNVSSEGAFITCKAVPPLDGDFYVVIEAPKFKTRCITGEVVWATILETSMGDPHIGIGVSFTNMSRNDRQFILRMIAKQCALKTGAKIYKS